MTYEKAKAGAALRYQNTLHQVYEDFNAAIARLVAEYEAAPLRVQSALRAAEAQYHAELEKLAVEYGVQGSNFNG